MNYNASGTVDYATYFGGSTDEFLCGITADPSSEVTIAGPSTSTDFPVANAFQALPGGGRDIVVTRFNAAGDALVYSTYYGGAADDSCSDIDSGTVNQVFISGATASAGFPIIGGAPPPEPTTFDGILVALDPAGQPIYSIRSNILGSDEFNSVDVDEFNTAIVSSEDASEAGTIIQILEKTLTDPIHVTFTFNAPAGHSINTAYVAGNQIALAGSFFAAPGKTGASGASGAEAWAAKVKRVITTTEPRLVDGILEINILQENSDGVKPGVDEDGIVTINGVPTGLKADDVTQVVLTGSDGDDDIDVSEVNPDNFSGLSEELKTVVKSGNGDDTVTAATNKAIDVEGGAGNDTIIGGGLNDFLQGGMGNDTIFGNGGEDAIFGDDGNDRLFGENGIDNMFGGKGKDLVDGGAGSDHLRGGQDSDQLHGGAGNDLIEMTKDDEIVRGGTGNDDIIFELPVRGSTGKGNSLASSAAQLILSDVSGTDSLSFAGYGHAIILDLDVMGIAQSIDASDTQISLDGIFEVVVGSAFDDEVSLSPLTDAPRSLDGGGGTDVLHYRSVNAAMDDGSTITTTGFADVAYVNVESVDLSIIVAIDETDPTLPATFNLGQNYPNPFNPTTSIQYSLPDAGNVSLTLYNALGQRVAVLVNEHQIVGNYSVTFNAADLPSGMYIYEMRAGNFISTKKMMVLK